MGFNITSFWIPSNVVIIGNKAADAAARDATFQGTILSDVLNSDFRTTFYLSVLVKWQRDWDHTQVNKLKEVKQLVQ
jgi:hypothetical protein